MILPILSGWAHSKTPGLCVCRTVLLLAAALFVACLPDEPRFTVTYRHREALVGGMSGLRVCLPVSAREITVHHDRIRGTQRGTFTFNPSDESLPALIRRSEVARDKFRHATAEWNSAFAAGTDLAGLRVFRCEQMRSLIAVNEATGEGYFREQQ